MLGASTVAEGNHIITTTAGNLNWVYANVPDVGYIMVFDATEDPADGSVTPVIVIPVLPSLATSVVWGVNFGAYPAYFSNGIVVVFSTTGPFTKTESASAYFTWNAQSV